jgi:hypothetical protein
VPGYWAWDDDTGYYWVPGTWVTPPEPELLWTPGYWGWDDGNYSFHGGYWGPHIGFYGGVAYGFGYTGDGYEGGYWRDGAFFYNRTVNNISNVSVTNVYNKTVVVNNTTNVSYNGGTGGTAAKPTPEQVAVEKEHHVAPTAEQTRHVEAAAKDPAFCSTVIMATLPLRLPHILHCLKDRESLPRIRASRSPLWRRKVIGRLLPATRQPFRARSAPAIRLLPRPRSTRVTPAAQQRRAPAIRPLPRPRSTRVTLLARQRLALAIRPLPRPKSTRVTLLARQRLALAIQPLPRPRSTRVTLLAQ